MGLLCSRNLLGARRARLLRNHTFRTAHIWLTCLLPGAMIGLGVGALGVGLCGLGPGGSVGMVRLLLLANQPNSAVPTPEPPANA